MLNLAKPQPWTWAGGIWENLSESRSDLFDIINCAVEALMNTGTKAQFLYFTRNLLKVVLCLQPSQ
jgi:hypothetical protein